MVSKRAQSQTVTLKTIADELGVSLSTVARSLKDGHKISPATVERVRETADRLGYVRNLDGVKLRTGQTFVVMALLAVTAEEEIGDSGSVGLLNGLHARLSDTNYSIRTIPVALGETGLKAVKEVVQGRNADGLVLDHTLPDDPRVQYLLDHNVPFVTFGRTRHSAQHAFFDIDNEYAAWQGTKALIDAGYRRIAFLDADLKYQFVQQRLVGYTRALTEAGLSFDPSLVRHTDIQADQARETARELTQIGADSFVCVNELMFFGARAGVLDTLGANGDAVGFSVRTGTNLGAYIGTRLFASYLSRVHAGRSLADLVLRRINGADPLDCQMIAKTELRVYEGIRK